MAAIITDDFRRNQAELLVNDIKASLDSAYDNSTPTSTMQDQHRTNSIYAIGLGKTDKWPNDISGKTEDTLDFIITAPRGTQQENEDIIHNLFTLKEVAKTGVSQLIAKNTWTQGRKYKVYDASDNDCFYVTGDVYPSYVTHNNQIYLCVSNTGLTNATSSPSAAQTAPSNTGQTVSASGDGYVWAHLQALPTTGEKSKFITPQFAPVLKLDPTADATAIGNSTTYQGGLLSHIGIVDGGTGYTSTTTVTVTATKLDGTVETAISGFSFKPIISAAGVIERIEIQSSPAVGDTGNSTYWGSALLKGLRGVTVTIADSNQPVTSRSAQAFGLVAPALGWGSDAIGVLPTWFVGVIAEFIGTQNGDAPALKFRQVSLLKNFERNVADTDSTTESYDALKYIECASITDPGLVPGDILKQDGSNARFYFDAVDGTKLYYHQNSNGSVNYIDPITGTNSIKVAVGASVAAEAVIASNITSIHDGEFLQRDSVNNEINGEVIFHENRVPFARTATQTEEVKLIVQL